jgi:hypothetical protein
MIDRAKTFSISIHEYTFSESLKQCCTWTTHNQVYFQFSTKHTHQIIQACVDNVS